MKTETNHQKLGIRTKNMKVQLIHYQHLSTIAIKMSLAIRKLQHFYDSTQKKSKTLFLREKIGKFPKFLNSLQKSRLLRK